MNDEQRPDWMDGKETVGDEADAAAAKEVVDLEPEEAPAEEPREESDA